MNLLNIFEQIFSLQEKHVAKVTAVRGGGVVVAETLGGAVVLLKGDIAVGKMCYYDRVSFTVLMEAPQVEFKEYAV